MARRSASTARPARSGCSTLPRLPRSRRDGGAAVTALDGVRVLEVAEYGMVPAAATVLAEWGADVIKVEHATRGDAIRGLRAFGIEPGTGGFTYLWEVLN